MESRDRCMIAGLLALILSHVAPSIMGRLWGIVAAACFVLLLWDWRGRRQPGERRKT